MTRQEAEKYIDVLYMANNHYSGESVSEEIVTPDGIIRYEGVIYYNVEYNYVDGYLECAFVENERIEYTEMYFIDNDDNEFDLLKEVA